MKNNKKLIFYPLIAIVVVLAGMYVYQVHFNYRFRTVEEGKVYRSGVILPAELPDYIAKYHIKSVIDLRYPGVGDAKDNPEKLSDVLLEKKAVESVEGVRYFNIKSDQIPSATSLDSFYTVMDNPDNYPVLIHCYHGVGRAGLYSAIYQIEYEGLSNEQARTNTRSFMELRPLLFSSFDKGKAKGEFLINYKKRTEK